VEKITIENSVFIDGLSDYICTAIGQGYINSGIQHLIFRASPTSTREPGYTISFPNTGAYPRLTTLDFSQAACSKIYIQQLPDTITCLCVNGSIVIEGSAPSIVRLEIREDKDACGRLEPLLTKALPALKEVNISSSSLFDFSDVLLAILLGNISSDLYITVSALHIHRPTWLEEVYAKFKGRFRLPQEIIFHLYLPDEIAAFSRLTRQGVFNHLKKIQYQTEEIMDPSTSFISTVVSLLQEGQLP
jgi:hypothetical protein